MPMGKPSMKPALAAAVTVLSMTVGRAWAGNDAYFVTYSHHIAKGELELMIMNDATAPSKFRREDDGQHTYVSNMTELEYGVTRQFATELMLEAFEEPAPAQHAGFFDLLQREPQPLRAFDETHVAHRIGWKGAIARRQAPCLGQEPTPLVVANRLAVHAAFPGDSASSQVLHTHPL